MRTMRKLRIWPARATSLPAGAPLAAPFFHFDASIELSDEISVRASPPALASVEPLSVAAAQVARTPSPNSTFALPP